MNATANDTLPDRMPGYRAAWDDCGGAGASNTWRMRSIAAKIKGFAKPRRFIRNAAQDAGRVDPSGTKPGPGSRTQTCYGPSLFFFFLRQYSACRRACDIARGVQAVL